MQNQTKTCPYCQKQLPVETNFCWYCTRQLEARPERPDATPKSNPWGTRLLVIAAAAVTLLIVYLVWIQPLLR